MINVLRNSLIIISVFLISNSSIICQNNSIDSITIYLIKESWHTGIMIPVNDYTINKMPVINFFKNYLYVDIGWGDEDFYQTPGFDLFLAAKAILIPTPTVIRIDGYKYPIDTVIQWRDFAIQFTFSDKEFEMMAKYINESFRYDEEKKLIISKWEEEKPIIFFKSNYYYYFLRTCNTWAAEVIQAAGINVDTFGLVTAGQLYSKFAKYGVILKKFN